jgi:hypothetical protein
MRLNEIAKPNLKTYSVKVKVKSNGYINIIDTTVSATTPQWARKLVRAQYNNNPNVEVGQPREVKPRYF